MLKLNRDDQIITLTLNCSPVRAPALLSLYVALERLDDEDADEHGYFMALKDLPLAIDLITDMLSRLSRDDMESLMERWNPYERQVVQWFVNGPID